MFFPPMQMAIEMNMNVNHNKDLEEDEELASLRLAALLSRKSRAPAPKEAKVEAEKYSNPINTIVKSTNQNAHFSTSTVPYIKKNNIHASAQNNSYTWRKPRWNPGQSHKTSQRSNLIVISPIDMEKQTTSTKVEKPPSLALPQDKWFPKVQDSANEDSSSPSTFRKTGPSRFNRHDSDSDSSDPEIDDDDDNSCSRSIYPPDNYAEHSNSNSVKADTEACVELFLGANDINDEESSPAEKVADNDTNSNFAVSPSKNLKLINGVSSNDSGESESASNIEPSSSNFTEQVGPQGDKSPSPVWHFENITMEKVEVSSLLSSISHTAANESPVNEFHLSSEENQVACVNESEPMHVLKAEASDHSPDVSSSSEKHHELLKDSASKVTMVIENLPDTSNLEIKSQPLCPEDLRLALKKRREERLLNENLKECDKDKCVTRSRSRSPNHSRSESSGGSSSDSSSSTDFVVKSVSSIVKTVHSDKGHDANASLHLPKYEHSSDKRRNRHRTDSKNKQHGSSLESPEPDKCSRKWNTSDMQRKYSSGIKVQLSEAKRSYDIAPDVLNNKRVPVHLRLGNPLRKRVIQMTGSTCFSDSDDTNDVNSKCKKPNLQIVAEMNGNKIVEEAVLQKHRKKASSGHAHSLKEKQWKKSAR